MNDGPDDQGAGAGGWPGMPSGLVFDTGGGGEAMATVPHPADKNTWRRRARHRRPGVNADHVATVGHLARFVDRVVDDTSWVVVYLALPGEVDLSPLSAAMAVPAARLAVTRTPASGFELTVHPLACRMEDHPYGYRQPVADAPRVELDEIGAFLVPGLAFDRRGTRLGRGKGYYDRLLARAPGALRVGITGDYLVERLPVDDYDVPMTHLAFSSGVVAVPVPGRRDR